jgi:etoposide-induced 2.4 mRNA
MATHARPVPHDPYNPQDATTIAYPSPYLPIRVPVFAPVIAIDDSVLRVINFVLRGSSGAASETRQPERGWRSVDGTEEGMDKEKRRSTASGPKLRSTSERKKVD